MRWKIVTASALAMMVGTAAAQDLIRESQDSNELRGSWVIGATVTSPDDETVGTIDDILLDQEDGRVTGAVLQVGGFLGIGGKQIAVEWQELEFAFDANEVQIDLTREEAEQASAFDFRERNFPPPPEPTTGTGTGMGTGTGTGTGGGIGQ